MVAPGPPSRHYTALRRKRPPPPPPPRPPSLLRHSRTSAPSRLDRDQLPRLLPGRPCRRPPPTPPSPLRPPPPPPPLSPTPPPPPPPPPHRDQASQLRDALLLAHCQPEVGAFFNFELIDEDRLAGWQSGVMWRDGTRKPSYEAFRKAVAHVQSGEIDCSKVPGAGGRIPEAPPDALAGQPG